MRKYLKTREDTVKCIVESLLDESAMELREELMKGGEIFLSYPPPLPRGKYRKDLICHVDKIYNVFIIVQKLRERKCSLKKTVKYISKKGLYTKFN